MYFLAFSIGILFFTIFLIFMDWLEQKRLDKIRKDNDEYYKGTSCIFMDPDE
jgi:hypothetical protein